MTEPKARILARRGALVAAALAAACDRCEGGKAQPCLEVVAVDDGSAPRVCLSPAVCLKMAPPPEDGADAAAAQADASTDGGGRVTLGTIDVTVGPDGGTAPSPRPCLSVAPPPRPCLTVTAPPPPTPAPCLSVRKVE